MLVFTASMSFQTAVIAFAADGNLRQAVTYATPFASIPQVVMPSIKYTGVLDDADIIYPLIVTSTTSGFVVQYTALPATPADYKLCYIAGDPDVIFQSTLRQGAKLSSLPDATSADVVAGGTCYMATVGGATRKIKATTLLSVSDTLALTISGTTALPAGSAGKVVTLSGAAGTLTLTDMAANECVVLENLTGNTYTIAAGTGAIRSPNGATKLSTQYGSAFVRFDGTDFHLSGRLSL